MQRRCQRGQGAHQPFRKYSPHRPPPPPPPPPGIRDLFFTSLKIETFSDILASVTVCSDSVLTRFGVHKMALKCIKIVGAWGCATDPAGWAYDAPPNTLVICIGYNIFSFWRRGFRVSLQRKRNRSYLRPVRRWFRSNPPPLRRSQYWQVFSLRVLLLQLG